LKGIYNVSHDYYSHGAAPVYRRQFAFASLDLALHDVHPENEPYDCVGISNPILEKVFLPIDPSSRAIVPELRRRGYDVTFREFDGGHEVPAEIARDGMLWVAAAAPSPAGRRASM